jgi:hypothetical protein
MAKNHGICESLYLFIYLLFIDRNLTVLLTVTVTVFLVFSSKTKTFAESEYFWLLKEVLFVFEIVLLQIDQNKLIGSKTFLF